MHITNNGKTRQFLSSLKKGVSLPWSKDEKFIIDFVFQAFITKGVFL